MERSDAVAHIDAIAGALSAQQRAELLSVIADLLEGFLPEPDPLGGERRPSAHGIDWVRPIEDVVDRLRERASSAAPAESKRRDEPRRTR